jgi:hypothetical protein
MKEQIIIGIVGVVGVIGLVFGGMYLLRFFNAATLHTQVINPKPGVECVVVSAADSTAVDCWKTL